MLYYMNTKIISDLKRIMHCGTCKMSTDLNKSNDFISDSPLFHVCMLAFLGCFLLLYTL